MSMERQSSAQDNANYGDSVKPSSENLLLVKKIVGLR